MWTPGWDLYVSVDLTLAFMLNKAALGVARFASFTPTFPRMPHMGRNNKVVSDECWDIQMTRLENLWVLLIEIFVSCSLCGKLA